MCRLSFSLVLNMGAGHMLYHKSGVVSWHGETFNRFHEYKDLDVLLGFLSGGAFSMNLSNAEIINHGKASGVALGGNMSLIHCLISTDFIDSLDGAILFLEEAYEEKRKIDRMLEVFAISGVFDRISGLVLGSLDPMAEDTGREYGFSIKEILEEHLIKLDVPVVINAPFGHNGTLHPFPIGAEVSIDTQRMIVE